MHNQQNLMLIVYVHFFTSIRLARVSYSTLLIFVHDNSEIFHFLLPPSKPYSLSNHKFDSISQWKRHWSTNISNYEDVEKDHQEYSFKTQPSTQSMNHTIGCHIHLHKCHMLVAVPYSWNSKRKVLQVALILHFHLCVYVDTYPISEIGTYSNPTIHDLQPDFKEITIEGVLTTTF
jgi:hypothetical protein